MTRTTLLLLIAIAPVSTARAEDDWTGQWVFPRSESIPLRDGDGKVVMNWGIGAARVRRTEGNRILIRHEQYPGPYEGFVKKSEVVKLEDAPKFFTVEIAKSVKSPWAWANRADAWIIKGEHDKAVRDLSEVIHYFPTAFSYCERGRALLLQGEFNKAIEDYDEAIRLEPKNAFSYICRGKAWHSNADYNKALADFTNAIRLQPDEADFYYSRGLTWYQKLELDQAIEDFTEAIRLDPKSAMAYCAEALRGAANKKTKKRSRITPSRLNWMRRRA